MPKQSLGQACYGLAFSMAAPQLDDGLGQAHAAMLVLAPHGHSLRAALPAIHLWYLEKRRLVARLTLLPEAPACTPHLLRKTAVHLTACRAPGRQAVAGLSRLLSTFHACVAETMCSVRLQRRRQQG